jgi:type IX secretion system PorP/SprF family membrane protein
MKKALITLYVLVFVGAVLQAQSYHFSQFFSTPLLTNPANTGFLEGPYRLASNFRTQGQLGGGTYFTGYLSADFNLFQESISENHKAGAGIYLMNDQSLNGALKTNAIGLSAAYHVPLDIYGDHSIGLGFQSVYHQRLVDYSKLSFGNQFGSNGYDPSLPIGEGLSNKSVGYFDINAGILYNIVLEDRAFFGGVSAYNILRHQENVVEDEFRMPLRVTAQGGAQVFIAEYSKAYFSVTHMRQGNASETTVGAAYGRQLTDGFKNEINIGLWYRYKDAVIPYVGYHRDAFHVGLSYDHTISSLKTAAEVRNAYELTLLYKATDKSAIKTLIPWY